MEKALSTAKEDLQLMSEKIVAAQKGDWLSLVVCVRLSSNIYN